MREHRPDVGDERELVQWVDRTGHLRAGAVDRRPERLGDVGFALVDAVGGLAMVLPRPEVRVGDVGELHGVENGAPGALSQGVRPPRLAPGPPALLG